MVVEAAAEAAVEAAENVRDAKGLPVAPRAAAEEKENCGMEKDAETLRRPPRVPPEPR